LLIHGAKIGNISETCKLLDKKASERLFHDVQNGNLWADEGYSNYKEIISKFNKTPT
jgi:hypothetical protein